jgi:hypothetical protein
MWTSVIVAWLGVLDAEHDNLRGALEWSLASGQFDAGARLLFDIGQFLHVRRLLSEGLSLCREFLAREITPARRAELCYSAASLAMSHDIAATLAYGEALVDLGRELGDDRPWPGDCSRWAESRHTLTPRSAGGRSKMRWP